MSFITHGLQCSDPDCAHVLFHVVYRRSDGPPPCPVCGAPQHISWSHGRAPAGRGDGYGSFTPVDMGVLGKCETKEQFDRAMSVIKQRFPGQEILIEGDSETDKQTRVDEARQRVFEKRKKNNLNKTMISEIKDAQKAYKSEAKQEATRHNKDASKAKGKQLPSPAVLSGAVKG